MSDYNELASDPCRAGSTFSAQRLLAFAFLFVVMLGGGATLMILLADTSYGIQLGSAVSYTAGVILYGFAKNRNGIQPYLFTCPVVLSQYPALLKRHAAFLVAMVGFETIALSIKPKLPSWWLTASGRNMPPIDAILGATCIILALIEVITNRAVLERAHVERFGAPRTKDATEDTMSIFSNN